MTSYSLTPVTRSLLSSFRALVAAEDLEGPHADDARALFERVAVDDDFAPFLTLPAYALID